MADRELKTQVRCRPGDTILLGGITVSRAQDDFQSGLGILSRTEQAKQTELVITIRPKLLMFDEMANQSGSTIEPAVQPSSQPQPVVEPVVSGSERKLRRIEPEPLALRSDSALKMSPQLASFQKKVPALASGLMVARGEPQ